jgi:hypothetical protein
MKRLAIVLLMQFQFSFDVKDSYEVKKDKACGAFLAAVMKEHFASVDQDATGTQLMKVSMTEGCKKGFDMGAAYGEWKAKQ